LIGDRDCHRPGRVGSIRVRLRLIVVRNTQIGGRERSILVRLRSLPVRLRHNVVRLRFIFASVHHYLARRNEIATSVVKRRATLGVAPFQRAHGR
jgi:hypothetical protein